MNERILTVRELNRALLARQLLLQRSPLALGRALERVAGLQTQYAPSAYVGLWSRLRDFRRPALTTALEQRRAIQGTLMRSTIHIVSAGDFPLLAAGIRSSRREWWVRVARSQVEGIDMDAVARLLRDRLTRGPAPPPHSHRLLSAAGFPPVPWQGAGLWVEMVRVPPSGTWEQRRADLYGLADEWTGAVSPTEADGLEHLVRRYLGAFGPAPVSDIASWAGVPTNRLLEAVERLPLRLFRDERGARLFDVAGAPLPGPDTPAPVRFLPTWDATLLVHARRTGILPEPYRPMVFDTKTPHSVPTFLVDGAVAGTWRYAGGRAQLKPFERLARTAQREVEEEAGRLAAFHAD